MYNGRVILTQEWLDDITEQVNAWALNEIENARTRFVTFQLPFVGHSSWSMEVANQISGMKVQTAKKICSIAMFIDGKSGKVSQKVSVNAIVPSEMTGVPDFSVDIVMFWNGQSYEAVGILLALSEYVKVAAETGYKIEIACSKGCHQFCSPFMFWYYNDSKKVKGKYQVESLPLDVGSRDFMVHSVNLGYGSDPLLTLNGTKVQWAFELETAARENGNPDMIFNFWND